MLDSDLVCDFRVWVLDVSKFDWACAAQVWVAAVKSSQKLVGVWILIAGLLLTSDGGIICS